MKRMESLVPRKTSWRLMRKFLRIAQGTFFAMEWSDFFRREEEDILCAVRPWLCPWPCLISLLRSLMFPFSRSHACSSRAAAPEAIFPQPQLINSRTRRQMKRGDKLRVRGGLGICLSCGGAVKLMMMYVCLNLLRLLCMCSQCGCTYYEVSLFIVRFKL